MKTDRPRKRRSKGPPDATSGIPVVGIGGSAGALESFKAFFDAMPSDSGAAVVVIQHLAPAHESLLPELLAQHTRMRVAQVQEGTPVEPNCVFVIPPNQDLGIRDGVLFLTDPVKHDGIRMPIDFFFRSLAEDRRERAICILFSGAGSDGTLGVRAVRGAGGMTIAQDPQTAQFADMPRSAIATKLVDYVLPPDRMPETVTDYLRHPYVKGGGASAALEAEGKTGGLDEILGIVRTQTSCDFRCYKKNTILRRIERRMGLQRVVDVAEYIDLLRRDAVEVGQLLKDLLINVTSFFRDAEVFEELRSKAIAPLVAAKEADEPLRVWTAGCSTGEEVYSLAMLLMEEMAAARKNCPLQVFATDIDEEALQFARQGVYPESIAADVGPERLSKFFVRKDHGCQIGESLRNAVVFAAQNLITDPPFSKMDLISCRNLLIYLDTETQAKLVPLFNFALNPGGVLFLGKSEGVGSQTDLFSVVSKKARIYRRSTPPRPVVLDSPIMPGSRKTISVATLPSARHPRTDYADAIRYALLGHFAAAVVLVDPKGQILQFHGQTGKYLDMPAAEPNLNLLDIAKEGLALKLRLSLRTANDERKRVVVDGVPVTRDPGSPCVRVTVSPLARRGESEPLLAVIFEDVARPPLLDAEQTLGAEEGTTVRRLEDELKAAQQDLQANIADLQASNEELRVSNEEVVSTNEELQSTNEELETSKEELQSVNEELTTVNSQLQEKVERLDTAYSDMANLLKSTRIATLFLDCELRIKFFTPDTTRVLKLINSDMGRPLGDLSVNFVDYDLAADARTVAQGSPDIEREARQADGSIYMVRVMPYCTQEDRVDGVVVTFDDVSDYKRAEKALRESEARYREQFAEIQSIYDSAHVGLCVFDRELRFVRVNQRLAEINGIPAADHIGKTVDEVVPGLAATAKELSERILRTGEGVTDMEISGITGSQPGEQRTWVEQWLPLKDAAGQVVGINVVVEEITARKRAEQREQEALTLAAASQTAVDVLDAMGEGVLLLDMDGRITSINPALEKMAAVPAGEVIGRPLSDILSELIAPEDRAVAEQALVTAMKGRAPDLQPMTLLSRTGRRIPVVPSVTFVHRPGKKPTAIVITLRDISQIRAMQQSLEESERKYRELVENANSIIIRITPDHRITFFNEYAQGFFGYSTEEVLGKSVIGTIVPATDSEGRDLREMTEEITAHPEEHGSNDNENIRKDGRRVWIHWSNRAIRDEHGAVREILCVGIDMTERRKLARKADAYRRRLRRLADRLTATEEQERHRVATEIHDTVVQTLSLSNIRLGGVLAAVEKAGLAEQRKTVEGIRRLLDQGAKECRGLMEELVPSLLYEVGLHAALREFAQKQNETLGTTIHVDGDDSREPIDNALRGLLFQCARELIMNAQKHAGPCEIRVSVSSDDHHLQLRVQDNGRGFDPVELDGAERDHADGGFGLFNVRERVEGLGGRLDIESAPGKGTTATVRVPVGTGQ